MQKFFVAGVMLAVGAADVAASPQRSVQVDPTGWIVGRYAGGMSTAVTDRIAMRLDGTYASGSELVPDDAAVQASLTATVYLHLPFNGPFIEGGAVGRSMAYPMLTDDPEPMIVAYRERSLAAVAYAGWQWTADSGLTIAAAMGGSRTVASSATYFGGLPRSLESYLRLGYAW